MRIATYLQAGQTRIGAVTGDSLVDLNRAYATLARDRGAVAADALADATVPSNPLNFLKAGDEAIAAAREAIAYVNSLDVALATRELLLSATAEAHLLPPVPAPPKIICVGRNYAEHAKEAGFEISEIPIIFARFAATLVAHGQPVVRPAISEQFDWEGELAVVIGKGGRNISRQEAMDHVAGYSVFNDVTVRDFQFRTTQYTAGKNFQASGPFGPHLVLKDEVPDPHVLEITTHIDGELMQRGNTRELIFDIPTIISHLSEFIQLEPGDVIPTGTPSGVGFKRTPPRFLKPGEVVRVEIPGIGVLENPVIDESEM